MFAFIFVAHCSALEASSKHLESPQHKSILSLRRKTEAAINQKASRLWRELPETSKQNLYKTTFLLLLSAAVHNNALQSQSRSASSAE